MLNINILLVREMLILSNLSVKTTKPDNSLINVNFQKQKTFNLYFLLLKPKNLLQKCLLSIICYKLITKQIQIIISYSHTNTPK